MGVPGEGAHGTFLYFSELEKFQNKNSECMKAPSGIFFSVLGFCDHLLFSTNSGWGNGKMKNAFLPEILKSSPAL